MKNTDFNTMSIVYGSTVSMTSFKFRVSRLSVGARIRVTWLVLKSYVLGTWGWGAKRYLKERRLW